MKIECIIQLQNLQKKIILLQIHSRKQGGLFSMVGRV
jgi:hypothetical protein